MDGLIKSQSYNGHDLTIFVTENTGTGIAADGTTVNTHSISFAVDNLTSDSFIAGSTGSDMTDAALGSGRRVAAVSIAGGDNIYTTDTDGTLNFKKPAAGNTLTFLDGTTVTSGQTVAIYYLDPANATKFDGYKDTDFPDILIQTETSLKDTVDNMSGLDSVVSALGYTEG